MLKGGAESRQGLEFAHLLKSPLGLIEMRDVSGPYSMLNYHAMAMKIGTAMLEGTGMYTQTTCSRLHSLLLRPVISLQIMLS